MMVMMMRWKGWRGQDEEKEGGDHGVREEEGVGFFVGEEDEGLDVGLYE